VTCRHLAAALFAALLACAVAPGAAAQPPVNVTLEPVDTARPVESETAESEKTESEKTVARVAAQAREQVADGKPEVADALFRTARLELAAAPAAVRADLALRHGDLLASQVQDAGSVEVGEALAAYRQAIDLGTPRQQAVARNNIGVLQLSVGPPDAAVRAFASVGLAAVPAAERHLYRYNLGRALEAANRPAEAVDRYVDAVRLDPSYAPASRHAVDLLVSSEGDAGVRQAATLAGLLLDGAQYGRLADTLRPLMARWPRPELLAPWVAALAAEPPTCERWSGDLRAAAPGRGAAVLAPWFAELDHALCGSPRLPATGDPAHLDEAFDGLYTHWRRRHDTAAALATLLVALGDRDRRAGDAETALARYFFAWRLQPSSALATERCAVVVALNPERPPAGGDAVLRALLEALHPGWPAESWDGDWQQVVRTRLMLAAGLRARGGDAAREEELRQLSEAAATESRRGGEVTPSAGLHLQLAPLVPPAGAADEVLRSAEILLDQGDVARAAAVLEPGGCPRCPSPLPFDSRRLAALHERIAAAWVAEGTPRLEGGAPLAAAGKALCVCGSFPRPEQAYALRLDGRPLPETAIERRPGGVSIDLPAGLAPGRHVVSGDPAVGYAPGGGWSFDAVHVDGGLAGGGVLVPGSSDELVLTVEGTTTPVTLEIRNRSPEVVRLEGGDAQRAATSGGRDNTLRRRVRALAEPGQNDFRFSCNPVLPPCICDAGGAGAESPRSIE